jgi:hypothetical protein
METLLRRDFLAGLGMLGGGSLLLGCGMPIGQTASQAEEPSEKKPEEKLPGPKEKAEKTPIVSWPWHPLDPQEAAQKAYDIYPDGSCTYAVMGGVILLLAERFGQPYRSFPLHMARFGREGIAGLGSVCGVLSGGAALVSLFIGEKDPTVRDALIRELAFWYESTELPIFRPAKPQWADNVATCRADSVLCHISALRWTQASGRDAYSQEKKERCRRISADGAWKTVELLNRHFAGQTCLGQTPKDTQTCLECHGKKQLRDIRGEMRCSTCHPRLSEKHPKLEPPAILKPPSP